MGFRAGRDDMDKRQTLPLSGIEPRILGRPPRARVQGCTNPGRQVTVATTNKFCTVAPNICGSLAKNLFHVTLFGA